MSITVTRTLPCRACGASVEGLTIESANPIRHPAFQERLLGRTLLRMTCGSCGAPHLHFDRFVWTDLPGRLCACVVHEEERPAWEPLERDAYAALSVPLREEGPPVVRAWGRSVAIRLVFGLEELREKVICRIHGLDDRIIEALKLTSAMSDGAGDGAAPVLEDVVPEQRLSFRLTDGARRVDVPWEMYTAALGRQEALAVELPGLFAERSTWVHCRRALRFER